MKQKRIIALMLVLALVLSLAACGGNTEPNKPVASGGNDEGISADSPYAGKGYDLSEHRTIIMAVLGNPPTDMDKVLEKANKEYFEPWLNATLELNFLGWGDSSTKYSLLLSGGDPVDIIYTADWVGYTSQAINGGFKDLSPEFLQTYLPYSYADQTATSWKQVSIDNVIYAIPASGPEFNAYSMVLFRQDLLEKYNLDAINSWDTLKNALITVSQNEEGMYGIGQRQHDELLWPWWQTHNVWYLDESCSIIYHTDHEGDLPDFDTDIEYMYTSPLFYEYLVEMNEMASKNVWDPNVINETTLPTDLFESGRLACQVWNNTISGSGKNMEDAGIGTYMIYDVSPECKVQRAKATNNMFSISPKSEDPERATLVLDCMRAFKEVNFLLEGGIEGEHYILTEDGFRQDGPAAANYPWSSWAWGINRPDTLKVYTDDSRQLIYFNTCERKEYAPTVAGFSFNPGPVETELAVINEVIGTYEDNLMLGMYGDDLEAKYQEFVSKLKDAGLDRVMEEVKRQYEAFCEGT